MCFLCSVFDSFFSASELFVVACFLMRERKKMYGFGWVVSGRLWEELGEGKVNRIYYMKKPIFNKKVKDVVVFLIERLT